MLAEHRIDDANEGFIAVEQPVPPGRQISSQPTLALVLAEHRVQYASGRREEFIVIYFSGVPLTIGDLENRAQEIRQCLKAGLNVGHKIQGRESIRGNPSAARLAACY